MVFDLIDLMLIIVGIFCYIVMGFGFVSDVNKVTGFKFSPVDLAFVALWPLAMFTRSLIGFFK